MSLDIAVLRGYLPFSELDDSYLEDALQHITEKQFQKGDMIFKRGRTVADRFFLRSGRVELIDASFTATSLDASDDDVRRALNPETPTRVSCIAKSPVHIFSLPAESLDRIVAWSQSAAFANEPADDFDGSYTGEIEVANIADEEANDWMSSLLQSPLFTRIPLTQVQELFARFKEEKLMKGEQVIKEGAQGDYFYVLASGRARVTNRTGSVDVVLNPGSYFGEEALLGKTPRNATVTMAESGIVKRLEAEDFEALLKAPILQYVLPDELETLGKPHKIIDVKMPMEYRMYHAPGSINVPLARLRGSMKELAKSSAYLVPDDAGSRADIAAHLLCQAGFDAYILKNPTAEADATA